MIGERLERARTVVGRVHRAVWLGSSLIVAGFVVMYLGWRGSARTFFVPSQVSFLISGGVIGLALVGTGLVAVTAHVVRLGTVRRSRQLEKLTGDVRDLVALAAATQDTRRPPGGRR